MTKILSVWLRISGTVHYMIVIFGRYTCVKWWYLQQVFYFSKFWFLRVSGAKRAKNDLNYQFQYVLLYISGTGDYIIEILIIVSTGCVFLDFFFLNEALQILKLFCFLFAHFNNFLNNYLFFKFINKCQKKNSEVYPTFFTCVWFY